LNSELPLILDSHVTSRSLGQAHSPPAFVAKRRRAGVERWVSPRGHLRLALLPFLPASRFPDDIITIKRQKLQTRIVHDTPQQGFRTNNNYAPFHPSSTIVLLRSSSPNPLTVASSFFLFVIWTNRDVSSGRVCYDQKNLMID
ncbi:hypothetical protein T12_8469, partial [Trichinella patagoniensis]